VWHGAVFHIIKSISGPSIIGQMVKCGDEITRLLYPIILILAADFEEQ
jgi:hypothetical protein